MPMGLAEHTALRRLPGVRSNRAASHRRTSQQPYLQGRCVSRWGGKKKKSPSPRLAVLEEEENACLCQKPGYASRVTSELQKSRCILAKLRRSLATASESPATSQPSFPEPAPLPAAPAVSWEHRPPLNCSPGGHSFLPSLSKRNPVTMTSAIIPFTRTDGAQMYSRGSERKPEPSSLENASQEEPSPHHHVSQRTYGEDRAGN
ncbi:uncharacterized protein LOC122154005 [Tyto alba]|uniref:uncharacterized protein LOC122154005 n=1 Tax=Tyto alba TaxID=56313 RepID=UPI001C66E141|nr:uncharacterized protein LOC122154005 [Tyto alba]